MATHDSRVSDGDEPQADEPIDWLTRPLRIFAAHRLSGAAMLLAATIVALIWANSHWADGYHAILATPVSIGVGTFELPKPLHLWINDALMAIFFFVIGLEIKREFLAGALASMRLAMLPIAGAVGGMIVPAAVYLLVVGSTEGARGWGVPMATDIAFALGVLALLGDRVPISLKVFLTALAIVDDLGAILVIAMFYSEGILVGSLIAGGALILLSIGANASGVKNPIAYFILGTLVWFAFLKSGVHATLAAVLMAFTIPAHVRLDPEPLFARLSHLRESFAGLGTPTPGALLGHGHHQILEVMADSLNAATPPLQRLEHALLPVVTFLVIPIFALANAGVSVPGGFAEAARNPVALGIVLGLFVGKQTGIFAFSWLAVRLGLADLPTGVSWRQLHGVAVLGGIGFTMSLFIGSLAFAGTSLEAVAKVGILLGSAASALAGLALVASSSARTPGQKS
jgi:NhaA family Na+:H+ antiporter